MADKTNIGFYHLAGELSTITPEKGVIYFSDAEHTIGVYDGTSMQKYYGGNVKDAVYAGKKLTISYYDGTADAVLDFNDVASASGVTSLLSGLRDDVTTLEGKVNTLEGDSHTHANESVLDGITSVKVAAWDAAEQNAKDYADGLAGNYDEAGAADAALASAKSYVDGKVDGKFDAIGSAATVKSEVIGADGDAADTETIHGAKAYAKSYADGLAVNYDAAGSAAAVKSEVIGADGDDKDSATIVGAKKYADSLNTAMDARVDALEAIDHNKIATDAAAAAVAGVIDGAPEKFDTLKEIAQWISDSEAADSAADLVTRVSALEAIDHNAYKAADNNVKTELIGTDADTADSATIKGAKKYADSLASNYAAASHTHAIADVTGLQDALDEKAASTHTHAIADVTGLQTALDGKADSDHNHDGAYDAKGAADNVKSAVIGVDSDDKTKDTIYGAKAYADAAVAAATLVWKQF